MGYPVQDFAVDEFGRFYLCDEDGSLFNGPYDTLEDAMAELERIEASRDEDA